jgi:hypothetical protein
LSQKAPTFIDHEYLCFGARNLFRPDAFGKAALKVKMENLLWLLAWHGAAFMLAALWTAPRWSRRDDLDFHFQSRRLAPHPQVIMGRPRLVAFPIVLIDGTTPLGTLGDFADAHNER